LEEQIPSRLSYIVYAITGPVGFARVVFDSVINFGSEVSPSLQRPGARKKAGVFYFARLFV